MVYHGYESLIGPRLYKAFRCCLSVSRIMAVAFSSLALWPQHLRHCALRADMSDLYCFAVLSRIQQIFKALIDSRKLSRSLKSLGCCSDFFCV